MFKIYYETAVIGTCATQQAMRAAYAALVVASLDGNRLA
jgi:hypothetical protein